MYVFVFQELSKDLTKKGFIKSEGYCIYLKNKEGKVYFAGTHFDKSLICYLSPGKQIRKPRPLAHYTNAIQSLWIGYELTCLSEN